MNPTWAPKKKNNSTAAESYNFRQIQRRYEEIQEELDNFELNWKSAGIHPVSCCYWADLPPTATHFEFQQFKLMDQISFTNGGNERLHVTNLLDDYCRQKIMKFIDSLDKSCFADKFKYDAVRFVGRHSFGGGDNLSFTLIQRFSWRSSLNKPTIDMRAGKIFLSLSPRNEYERDLLIPFKDKRSIVISGYINK